MPIIAGASRFTRPDAPQATHFVEHLRSASLSVGTYSLSSGGTDDQTPHRQDEVYVVVAGSAAIEETSPSGQTTTTPVSPGEVIFVAAGVAHRFVDVSDDLTLVVVFAPPYTAPPA